jgi:hypothetical protein
MKRIIGLRTRDLATLMAALSDAVRDREGLVEAYTVTDYGTRRESLDRGSAHAVQGAKGAIKRYVRLRSMIAQELRLRRNQE